MYSHEGKPPPKNMLNNSSGEISAENNFITCFIPQQNKHGYVTTINEFLFNYLSVKVDYSHHYN